MIWKSPSVKQKYFSWPQVLAKITSNGAVSISQHLAVIYPWEYCSDVPFCEETFFGMDYLADATCSCPFARGVFLTRHLVIIIFIPHTIFIRKYYYIVLLVLLSLLVSGVTRVKGQMIGCRPVEMWWW